MEDYPAKRWWWFLGFGLVGAWLFIIALLLQSWSHLLLIGVVVPSLIVLYAQKPRAMTYELNLDDETITINGRDRVHLSAFRSFTIDEPVNPERSPSVTLVPDRIRAWPLALFLPPDASGATEVVETLSQSITFTAPGDSSGASGILDRTAKRLGLR